MVDKGELFVREFVMGFGWVSGLFWRVGVDPETLILNALRDVYMRLTPDAGFGWLFWLVPILISITSWIGAFFLGGALGLTAVILALAAGFLYDTLIGWVLMFVAIILGGFAIRT